MRDVIKHRVRFTDAVTLFFDENAIFEHDPDHSEDEERYCSRAFYEYKDFDSGTCLSRRTYPDYQCTQSLTIGKGATIKEDWEDEYEMRENYDFSKGIKNPYFQDFRELNLISLDDDVKAAFPDSESVNTALRWLLKERAGVAHTELKKAS